MNSLIVLLNTHYKYQADFQRMYATVVC